MALAEPRTCKAYSKANVGSSTCISHPALFKSTATPESALKLMGPIICAAKFSQIISHRLILYAYFPVNEGLAYYRVIKKDFPYIINFSFKLLQPRKSSTKCSEHILWITDSARRQISQKISRTYFMNQTSQIHKAEQD